jgi:hypothetical protein
MVENTLIHILNRQLNTDFPEVSEEQLLPKLSFFINGLIQNDFQKLVTILYKVDVNENKLKQLLLENAGEDAAVIIAALLIERQLQKIETRKQFKSKSENDGEEKW